MANKVNPATGATSAKAKPARAQRPPTKRPDFIAVNDVNKQDPKQYPFTLSTPKGYVHGKFKRLKKTDFAKPSLFLDYQADEMELKSSGLRAKAELARKTGDAKGGTGKANRLVKMMQKAADLRKELEAQGIDVNALMGSTTAPTA